MAEAVVFSLASKILSTIASPAFNIAYEKGVSIWEARDELAKLQASVETIHAVLLDAEKKQEGSAGVKNWIKRLKGVLYDAEDLFDLVATENLLKQQMKEGKEKLSLKKKVHVSFSKLNPIVSGNSIAKKVKAIKKNLVDISIDMAQFQFVRGPDEKPLYNMGRGEDRGCFVDAKSVIGRDGDMEAMLEMLLNGSDSARTDNPIVLAIVGIGGMGKTTLAQLIYNDEKVRNFFTNRWFACISGTSDEREVLGKIFKSISGLSYCELDVGQLQIKIRESIGDQKYLLVLDDVWEDDRARWQDRISLLTSLAQDSRIIVTTRSPSVAKAVGALRTHNLKGLSEDDSWSLFKRTAFVEEYENDPRRESLGKVALKKCSGVPLAIRSIGSLLYLNNTIAEWDAVGREDLPVLERKYNDETMRILKLSYDHLPSHLKHCFAYCSLFPKDHVFSKRDLINHWIAQGYIDPNDEESSFMCLLRKRVFQEAKQGECGEIESCKMHDLMHDLAIYVAGEESIVLSGTLSYTTSCVRHVSFKILYDGELMDTSTLVLNAKSLRSLLLAREHQWCTVETLKLDQLFASFKWLRTLSLSKLGMENIPPSIGELKLMRYLDLSYNNFEELPQSVSNLVNLLSLNLEMCCEFKVWPLNFHKLINLRFLNVGNCDKLKMMPTGFGKMSHLQYLSDFMTEKGNECLNASASLLQQLRGKLSIRVWVDTDRNDCNWKLPVSLLQLEILGYQGMRIPGWRDYGHENTLVQLELIGCRNVKYLPSLRRLPNLRWLLLDHSTELEFMEEEEDGSKFFPCLEKLSLQGLRNLRRWWRKIAAGVKFAEFPRLHNLLISDCPRLEIESFPLCPQVKVLILDNKIELQSKTFHSSESDCPSPEEITAASRTEWQHSLGSLHYLRISYCLTLKSLHFASPHLQKIHVEYCNNLLSIKLVAPQDLDGIFIRSCKELKSIELHSLARSLVISDCEDLESLSASEHLIANLELLEITRYVKLRLETSAAALSHLGGSRWTVEATKVADIDLIEQLSWLPIHDIDISRCTVPIRFPVATFASLRKLIIQDADGLENLHLDASHLLQELYITGCRSLASVKVEAPFRILISACPALKNLRIADPNALKEFSINECPQLEELYVHELMRTQSAVPIRKCAFSRLLRFFQRPSIRVRRISEQADNIPNIKATCTFSNVSPFLHLP